MKRVVIAFTILISWQWCIAESLIIAPGSTTDVFTELAINDILNADTLFVDGGTGDIYLQAGPTNDGTHYFWDIGSGGENSYVITFTYAHATSTLSDGSKGRLIAVSRDNPNQSQYLWVVYRNLPTKPSLPQGEKSVCSGSSYSYTTVSRNAESYQWSISPTEAGTLLNDNTSTVTVNWSNTWSGVATLSVVGVKGSDESPASDQLAVNVKAAPSKPTISGSSIGEKGNIYAFSAFASDADSWEWFVDPDNIVNASPSGNTTSLEFLEVGSFSLTAYATNNCGISSLSDVFVVKIVDVNGMQSQIDQLVADTTSKGLAYRETISILTEENEDLLLENSTLEEQIIDLYSDVDSLKYITDSQEFLIADLESENQLLLTEIDDLIEDNYTLANKIVDLEDELDYLTAINTELEGQVAALDADIVVLENQVDELTTINLALEQEVEILNASVTSLEILVDDLMSTNMNLNNEITSLKEENSSLVKQVSDLENDVAELEEQLSILSQVYILTWDVEDVTTHAFQTEIGNFEISLYPNPSPGEVFISCTEMIEEVRVFNLQGQLLKQFDVNDYETSFTVNRSQMPVGTYLVHIKTAKGNSTHRMVFQ